MILRNVFPAFLARDCWSGFSGYELCKLSELLLFIMELLFRAYFFDIYPIEQCVVINIATETNDNLIVAVSQLHQ